MRVVARRLVRTRRTRAGRCPAATSIIPLLQKHRILAQVAGYHTEVIKFLPPMTITKADLDWFLGAMRDILTDVQRFPGAAWETVAGLAKRTVMA